MAAPLEWLLEGPAWIEFRTRCDLLGQPAEDPQVQTARRSMLVDDQVQYLLAELAAWEGEVISNHKSAGQPFHKLTFIADLGLSASDPGISSIVSRLFEHVSSEGPFQVRMNIPKHFGGTGQDQWAWALCDAPLWVYSLLKLGLEDQPPVQRAIEHLASLVRENGWPCAVSKELGKFRGPGRKDDPCPYANLAMLKMLAQTTAHANSPACKTGAETLLSLWENSLVEHPYMFYMGTDFRKLKAPFVWYDLLHVLEVLSQFTWLRKDARLLQMLAILKSKMDEQGRFTPESVWTAWKDWEFGQKKTPSRWLTLLAWRIIGRVEGQVL
ncbi:MAG: hypothetical protein ACOY16_08500 [Chloroflexota bacterium]